jgi:L-xylulokinase
MTSASNLEWFVREFFEREREQANAQSKNVYAAADAMVECTPPEDSAVIFLPFLYGTNVDANAKSCFLGLSGWHTKAHMLRAVYEGIVFSHRMHIEKLLALRDKPEAIRMAGGVTNSGVWVQMFADALQMPVEISDNKELGTLGVAMCAGVAVGEYRSLSEASSVFSGVSHVYMPDSTKKEIYDRKYELYKKTIECLAPIKNWNVTS